VIASGSPSEIFYADRPAGRHTLGDSLSGAVTYVPSSTLSGNDLTLWVANAQLTFTTTPTTTTTQATVPGSPTTTTSIPGDVVTNTQPERGIDAVFADAATTTTTTTRCLRRRRS